MQKTELQVQDYVSDCYEVARYQKSYARLYHTWWILKMLSFLNRPSGLLLDNGCGVGILSDIIKKNTLDIVSLDFSSGMLLRAANTNTRLIQGNSQQLPLKNETFDIVFARSLLHHLSDIERGISEMARILKPKGEMVIADTNASIINAIPRRIAFRSKHFSDQHKNLNDTKLMFLVKKYFTIEKVYYFGYVAYPFAFPDLIAAGNIVPFFDRIIKALIYIDEIIAHIPLVKKLSWGIIIKATKKG